MTNREHTRCAGAVGVGAALALAAALSAGCPPEEPPPPPPPPPPANCVVDTNFPNRDAETAETIEKNVPVTGLLCPARDDDGFRIHAAAGDVLIVTLSMDTNITSANPSYGLFLDNGDGTMTSLGVFSSDPDTSAGHTTNFITAHRVEAEGDYIIDVRDLEGLDDGFDNFNEYTLNVDIAADPDGNEPNNVPEQATPVTSGTPLTAQIATSGDLDWYAIDVPAAGQIIDATITVPAGSGVEHIATLFRADGVTVLQATPFAEDPTDATKETVRIRKAASTDPSGPYLLLVADSGSDGSDQDAQLDPAKGAYTLDLTVSADPDANEAAAGDEGNEVVGTASPINAAQQGTNISASLATIADNDTYRVNVSGFSAASPGVLVVTVDFAGTLPEDFKPELIIITANPEDGPAKACDQVANDCEGAIDGHLFTCYDNKCGEEMLQRFIDKSPQQIAFPLRSSEPVFVGLHEFGDDSFQDAGAGYTIKFDVQSDNDPGDDFLIPNLEFAGFQDGNQQNQAQQQQRERSKDRATVLALGYPGLCPEDAAAAGTFVNDGPGIAGGCIDQVPVPVPVGFEFPGVQGDCSDVSAGSVTKTFSGKLSYDGDRDFYKLDTFPAGAYWGMTINYDISTSTPVELAIFVHGDNGSNLAGSTLDAQAGVGCNAQQGGQFACTADEVCVDGTCWSDIDSNSSKNVVFGDGPGECVVSAGGSVNVTTPIFVEVVDNGINDFDLNMTYTLTLTVNCGCPANCQNGLNFCQQ